MKITITPEVFQKFHPHLKIAFLLVEKGNNYKKIKESKHLLQEAEKLILLSFNKDTIKTHHLISPWVAAQQEFGLLARHYHTAVEHLLKKVLTSKNIASQDTLTNLLHYLSLKYIVPNGVDDFQKIHGDLTFTLAKGNEKAGLLYNLKKGAFYYHDSKEILGTKLDYWKNNKTALTPKTTSALIHIEALPPLTTEKLREIVKEAQKLIHSFCGGKVKVFILDKKKKTMKI